jgi:hypothetical protein
MKDNQKTLMLIYLAVLVVWILLFPLLLELTFSR